MSICEKGLYFVLGVSVFVSVQALPFSPLRGLRVLRECEAAGPGFRWVLERTPQLAGAVLVAVGLRLPWQFVRPALRRVLLLVFGAALGQPGHPLASVRWLYFAPHLEIANRPSGCWLPLP